MRQFKTPLFLIGIFALFLLEFLSGIKLPKQAALLEANRQLSIKEGLLTELKNIDINKEKQMVTAKRLSN